MGKLFDVYQQFILDSEGQAALTWIKRRECVVEDKLNCLQLKKKWKSPMAQFLRRSIQRRKKNAKVFKSDLADIDLAK